MQEANWLLIPCDKNCRYQNQGYCALDKITCITSMEADGCGYFTAPEDALPASLNQRNGLQ